MSEFEKEPEVNESNTNNEQDDYGTMLPDGWAEGDDIFNPSAWAGQEAQADALEGENDHSLEELFGVAAEETPTTESSEDGSAEVGEESAEAPTTEPMPEVNSGILKFKARVDHEDRDVELNEADLPAIYQKAQVTDRVQEKLKTQGHTMDKAAQLAKLMGYESVDQMLDEVKANYKQGDIDKLVQGGLNEDVAKELIESRYAREGYNENPKDESVETEPETVKPVEAAPAQATREAEIKADVNSFYATHPELRSIKVPDEVYQATLKGAHFNQAYQSYLDKQQKAEAEKLRKENQILKQNAASAARAPVKGVKGGGATNQKGQSEFDRLFLEGFNSDKW